MKILILGASAFLLFFVSSAGFGQSEYLHQPHISTRVMGMGGADWLVRAERETLVPAAGPLECAFGTAMGNLSGGFGGVGIHEYYYAGRLNAE